MGLISCVVVVDPEITFGLERERHSAVLGKGVVHLCVRACVRAWVHVNHVGHVGSLPCRVFCGVEKRT